MADMDPDLALLSRSIDPVVLGERIKSARLLAGLTQRELSGGDTTPGYISRVEAGQRRPSLPVLKRIAAETGTSVESLLLGEASDLTVEQLKLDHAELALLAGDARTALDEATAVEAAAAEITAGTQARALVTNAQYVRASALEALGDLNAAVLLLESLTEHPEASVRWVKALIALCRCYKEQGELSRAIEVGERAAPVLSELGLDGLTESIQLAVSVAGAYMKQGDLDKAIRICTTAIESAEKVDSPIAKASAYWNASLIEGRRGSHHSALALAQRALASFEEGNDGRNVGRLRTQVAALQLKTTPPDVPAALARLAVAEQELSWSSASPMDKADHYLVLARAQFLSGNAHDALEKICCARELMGDAAPLLRAEAETLSGRIAFATGDAAAAHDHYLSAVQALTASGSDRDAAQTWFELAGLLDETGDRDGALAAYRSAAASTGLTPVRANTETTTPA